MTKFTQMAANEDDGNSRRRIHLREISGDGDAPLETVGQDLRAARIRRGDDLAAVSRALKIRKDHLEALESDRIDDLPGKTYAIGFVRSYARHLGLDANAMVDRFKAEISGRGDDHVLPSASYVEDDGRRLPNGWRILAVLVGVALLWGVWHIFFATREAAPPVPPPPSLVTVTPKPTPAPAPGMPDASQQAAAPASQADATPAPQAPAAQPTPSVQPKLQETQAAVPAVPAPAAGPQSPPPAGTRVVLRASSTTRITIKGPDGRLYANRDLAAGEAYNVPNLPGLSLAIANAGAVDVAVDGKSLGRIGQDRQVLGKVSLDPASLAERSAAH